MLLRCVVGLGKQTDRIVVICEGKHLADEEGSREDHLEEQLAGLIVQDGVRRYCGPGTPDWTWSGGRYDAARGVGCDGIHVAPYRVL
jgi:hypothetical protein